jgi:hypothetical protein
LFSIVQKYKTVIELKTDLERMIEHVEESVASYSNYVGEKLRIDERDEDPEFIELKNKFMSEYTNKKPSNEKKDDLKKTNSKNTPEKKKPIKKNNEHWYNLGQIMIYNGTGLKGELEIYFRAIDELKTKQENLKKILATLNDIIEKGLKNDIGCITFQNTHGMLHVAFLKALDVRENFSFKVSGFGTPIILENTAKFGISEHI